MLKTLLLRNFRNYSEQILNFHPQKNSIFGQNAQGKTNLIEAISLVTTGKSHRTHNLYDCIQHQKEYFYLEAIFEKDTVNQTIKLYYGKTKKTLYINKTVHSSFSPLIGLHPSIIHTPYDLQFISGTPSLRRKLFDLHLSQNNTEYLQKLIYYFRAKKQRDVLLKQQKQNSIECFEKKMSEYGHYLMEKRQALITQIQPLFLSYAKKFLTNKESTLNYLPSAIDIARVLEANRHKEFILGNTLQGPHRDEYSFSIDAQPARIFASEGQKKACILAFRLAEYEKLYNKEKHPIFCVDDILTHFDLERQKSLIHILQGCKQSFISFPDPSQHPMEGQLFFVKKGIITPY
jgi:DNA replication and repair protein RecF